MSAASGGDGAADRPPLIVFGEDWGQHPSSTQHIVSRLARDRDVIWVNSIGLRRPRFDRRDLNRVIAKLGAMARKAAPERAPDMSRSLPERVSVIAPRAVSFPGSSLAGAFNRVSLGLQIRAEITRRKLAAPLVWTSLPSALPVLPGLPGLGLVYYCGDDFGSLEGVDHDAVLRMERRLAEQADLILACSTALLARFPARKTRLMPHGVDVDLFAKPAPRAVDLPAGERIAGFFGSLSSWIDIEAIARAARSLPEWIFVLIGPVRCDVSVLAGLANVCLLGERAHRDLPGYVQHWTVSLLPFRDTPQIRACNPLKLREYLAAGRPIVSPLFEAVRPYGGLIEHYPFGGDLADAIRRAAADQARNTERRMAVAAESWDQRALEVDRLMSGLPASVEPSDALGAVAAIRS